jgi:hypothetical protein
MCDKNYPVVRTGSILRASRTLSADEAVVVAEHLYDQRDELTAACIAILQSMSTEARTISDIWSSTNADAVRIRTMPALTIDYSPINFRWDGNPMEFRACATVCSGARRAKLWTRYNLTEKQENKHAVKAAFDWVESVNEALHKRCIEFYNAQLAKIAPPVFVEPTYEILIKLMSVKNPELKEELEREFTQVTGRSPDAARQAHDLLIRTIEEDCGLTLPNKEIGERTLLVGFRYPRHPRLSEVGTEPAVEQLLTSPPLAEEDFGALCIVDYDKNGLRITGVAHEENPPTNYLRSAPHVISGEMSFEVGNAY